MECRKGQTLKDCNCTYPCERRGLCCECVAYHRASRELPACYFDAEHERTYDRSVAAYQRQGRGR
jgi:hypothetical protein